MTTISVTSTIVSADNNGCFLEIHSTEGPSQAWSKWYPNPETASMDGEKLGLTDRQEIPHEHGYLLTIRRRFKNSAPVDPENLLRFNFRPFVNNA